MNNKENLIRLISFIIAVFLGMAIIMIILLLTIWDNTRVDNQINYDPYGFCDEKWIIPERHQDSEFGKNYTKMDCERENCYAIARVYSDHLVEEVGLDKTEVVIRQYFDKCNNVNE